MELLLTAPDLVRNFDPCPGNYQGSMLQMYGEDGVIGERYARRLEGYYWFVLICLEAGTSAQVY